MAKRRANNEGSVTKRKDGRWLASLKVGIGDNGKSRYKYIYADSQKEAIQKLENLKASLNLGIKVSTGEITVSEWLSTWMQKYKQSLKPATKTSYYNNIRIHINPYIGGVKLNKLQTGQIQHMLDTAYAGGTKSLSLFVKIYNVLNCAMKQAVKNKMLKENPCEGIIFPEDNAKVKDSFTVDEQKRFVEALDGEQYKVLFLTYLYTGARLGELPALTWRDINFDKQYIDINKKSIVVHDYYAEEGKKVWIEVQNYCKSKSSIRKIYITKNLVETLKDHQVQQKEKYAEMGTEWTEDNLVYPTSVGTILHPRNIQTMFTRIRDKANISHGTMHTLRHTYATRCFEADIDIKIISQQLGHKNVKITYDTYVHVIPDKAVKEIEKLSALERIA